MKKRRWLSLFLSFAMVLTLLPTVALAAGPVSYWDWDADSKTLTQKTYTEGYTELTNGTPGGTTWSTGWYVVTGNNVVIHSRVTVSGNVYLILEDTATLTVNGGINVSEDNSLTIYGQSEPVLDGTGNVTSATGKLTATLTDSENAAIGGNAGENCGAITIIGGVVNATVTADSSYAYGAAIGGGYGNSANSGAGGAITINGGVVNATVTANGGGLTYGAAIGSGYYGAGGASTSITVNGGVVNATVTANGGGLAYGAAIGTGSNYYYGSDNAGGNITITGGTVTATAAGNGAAIGGGNYRTGGNITITGGTVTATTGVDGSGNAAGAAIGSGYSAAAGTIIITGGEVDARTTVNPLGAAIGSGGDGDGGTVICVTPVTVSSGSAYIPAIGGGYNYTGSVSGIWPTGPGYNTDYTVHGTVTLTGDLTVLTDVAIPDGASLTVQNSTLTMNGTLSVSETGTVNAVGTGIVVGSGEISPEGKRLPQSAVPAAPTVASVTADSVTLAAVGANTNGAAAQYSSDDGTTWQDSPVFTGLLAATSYTFYARYGSNNFYKASSASGASEPQYTAYAVPGEGEGYSVDYDAETITVLEGYEVNTASAFDGTDVSNGASISSYIGDELYIRKKADGAIPASAGTPFTISAQPADPTGSQSVSYSSTTYPPIVVQPDKGGTVTVSPKDPEQYDKVTVTPVPEEGYELDELIVTDKNGNPVALKDNGNGTYSFTQPGARVTVTARFKLSPCDGGANCPSRAFTDLDVSLWYHVATDFVIANGFMSGYGNGIFGPNDTASRAMLAQILYNMEGRPAVSGSSIFTDVPDGAWYTDAIIWAAANNIVNGYGDGTYGPNDPITREQFAAMLWRYADSPMSTHSLDGITDGDQISDYALEALKWANENGIVNGSGDGTLNPKGSATRVEVAQMLKNFLEYINA